MTSKKIQKAMPQEIDVWYILPAIRRELAISLKKEGMKQKDIAIRLRVTNAAISQYLSNKRASEIKFSDKIKKEIKLAAKRVICGGNAIKEIFDIDEIIKKYHTICPMCINNPINKNHKCEIQCSA